MKKLLKVKDYYANPRDRNRMIYVNDSGERYDGPKYNVVAGYTYVVEVGVKKFEDRYYHIIKFASLGKQE